MNKALTAAVVLLAFAPAGALAQERAGDAALGAVSGAVVLGPIGAVAGALVGYTAGPSIAHSWGLRHSRTAKVRQRPRGEAGPAMSSAAPSPGRERVQANGAVAQMTPASTPPVQAAPLPPRQTSAPPVQGFD